MRKLERDNEAKQEQMQIKMENDIYEKIFIFQIFSRGIHSNRMMEFENHRIFPCPKCL